MIQTETWSFDTLRLFHYAVQFPKTTQHTELPSTISSGKFFMYFLPESRKVFWVNAEVVENMHSCRL
jgi:hypothetical protein